MNFLILEGHRTFWQEVQFEIEDLFQTFIDFFVMIKENTYDLLVNSFGAQVVNMSLIALGALLIMLICLRVINR